MPIWIRQLVFFLIILGAVPVKAGKLLTEERLLVYCDSAKLSFEELMVREESNHNLFRPFSRFDAQMEVYWLKLDSVAVSEYDYLLLSTYFEYVHLYYPGDEQPYSTTGKFVEFEQRSYSKEFYKLVAKLKPEGGTVYIQLISGQGYNRSLRTLSDLKLAQSAEFMNHADLIRTIIILLIGMGLIILIINCVLLYLKPDAVGFFYIVLILMSLLVTVIHNRVTVTLLDFSVMSLHYLEIILGILIVYAHSIFTALYLRARKHARILYYLLLFPLAPLILLLAFFGEGLLISPVAGLYFLFIQVVSVLLVIKVWNKNRQIAVIYLIANAFPLTAATITALALNGLLPHSYFTLNAVYLGIILRDIIFTMGLILRYFSLLTDSRERKKDIDRLMMEKRQMEKIEQIKTVFFNNVSHELRTPLTLLLLPLESSLKSDKMPTELKNELQLSLKNGKYLLQLVNEILDLSKLDQGELALVRQPTDVVQVVNSIRETFQPYTTENNQTIFIAHARDSIVANLDQDKFEKIVINLLSNAIKYSRKPGNILIQVAEHGPDLQIQVIDESRGIPKQDLHRIFDRYYQSGDGADVEGTGIGLSIVKEFMKLHGGSVDCTSELHKGSTFTLHFPEVLSYSSNHKPAPEPAQAGDSGPRLLVVEDHQEMRRYLRTVLREYSIAEACNGQEALKMLREGLEPDLILTDYIMPEMDGHEFVLKLKAENRWSMIPIIFLTARTLSIDKLKVLNLGVDDYIIKPFDLEELTVRIDKALKVARERQNFSKTNLPDLTLEKQKTFKDGLDHYILENIQNAKLSNIDLAYHFMLSERNLYRRVKLVTGQPPASYIREIRLQKARLLLESDAERTIAEIARECGIENIAYFSQAFKKRFGTAPSTISKEKQHNGKV